jgi:RNA polymerase sigma factor (sigma-70 family)
MAIERDSALIRSIQALYVSGTTGELTDAQLLDRYLSRRGEVAEMAFRELVLRHGPMVMDVCRNVLRDPHDAQDAFQATFLILACKAGSIRARDSLASWLFGVARRVANRAKADAARRRLHEGKVAGMTATTTGPAAPSRDLAVLHEEVGRLPAKYREPVVLCYLEGLAYEAAARHLRCPVGTLSIRLKRARERLKARLTRRGLDLAAGPLLAHPAPRATPAMLSAVLSESTASPSSLSLARGVLRTMLLTKLKIVGLCVVPVCLLVAGGGTLVAQRPEPANPPKAEAGPPRAETPPQAQPAPGQALRRRLVDEARRRMEAQRAYYEEGRITIDRYLDAAAELKNAELLAASTHEERVAAVTAYLGRVAEVEKRERSELEIGRSTTADVAEAAFYHVKAELELDHVRNPAGHLDAEALDRRLSAVEKKLDQILRALPAAGRQ